MTDNTKKGVLNNGESIEYAGGLSLVQEYKGYEVVQHTGSWGGFISVFYRFPSLGKLWWFWLIVHRF